MFIHNIPMFIIKFWKGNYRKELVRNLLDDLDNGKEASPPDIKQAIIQSKLIIKYNVRVS